MEAKPPRRPDIETTMLEIFQNAVFAGATAVDVTTTADDYGGTIVVVTDNGEGTRQLTLFTEPGKTGWTRPPRAEAVRGHALTDCLGGQRFEIATRATENGPGLTIRHEATADELIWVPEPRTLLPPGRGTTIRFRNPRNRAETQSGIVLAAFLMPIDAVTVDGESVAHAKFLGNDDSTLVHHAGLRISVEKRRTRASYDTCLYGIPVSAGIKTVPADDGKEWVAHIDISSRAWPPGREPVQRSRTKRDKLVENAASQKLRTDGYVAILKAIADREPASVLPTEAVNDARALGINLDTTTAKLSPWGEPRRIHQRRAPRENDVIVELYDGEESRDNRVVRGNLRRALELNDGTRAFEPEPTFKGQPWYDRIPVVTDIRLTTTTEAGDTIDIEAASSGGHRVKRHADPIDAALLDAKGDPITTLKTDIALVGDEDDFNEAVFHVSKARGLTVARLVKAMESAFFQAYDDQRERRERAAFRAAAEYSAASAVEGCDDADLRQIIRVAVTALRGRIARQPTVNEEIRITLRADSVTAELVDTRTRKTIARSATYADIETL